jgi:hypothetical protein
MATKTTRSKSYKLPDYTFGVEIECYNLSHNLLVHYLDKAGIKSYGYDLDETLDQKYRPTNRRHRKDYSIWEIGEDGSVRGVGTAEVKSPILKGEAGLKEILKVCEVLKELGAKVNASCGLHVHVGIKNAKKKFEPDEIKKIMRVYEENSKETDRWFTHGRRTGRSQWAKPVTKRLELLEKGGKKQVYDPNIITRHDCWGPQYGGYVTKDVPPPNSLKGIADECEHYDRVSFSSYNSHGTMEFRQHHGTIDGQEITNWIRFLLNHVEVARSAKPVKQKKTAKKVLYKIEPLQGLPRPVKDHFLSRVKRYAKQTAQAA